MLGVLSFKKLLNTQGSKSEESDLLFQPNLLVAAFCLPYETQKCVVLPTVAWTQYLIVTVLYVLLCQKRIRTSILMSDSL